jgi:hypothetical protein
MEIKISNKLVFGALQLLSWIIFIGICIEAGGILSNSLYVLFINPIAAQNFWMHIDLSELYVYDKGYFMVITFVMSLVSILKGLLFYLIVKIFHEKKINISKPFNSELLAFTNNLCYVSLGIGFISYLGSKLVDHLLVQEVELPAIHLLGIGGADVWFFMGIVLLVIGQLFKRGVELQTENDLTI